MIVFSTHSDGNVKARRGKEELDLLCGAETCSSSFPDITQTPRIIQQEVFTMRELLPSRPNRRSLTGTPAGKRDVDVPLGFLYGSPRTTGFQFGKPGRAVTAAETWLHSDGSK
ncbi:MAG: hypothetical protein ACE5FS_08350 [Paracoccaceae bacterium]